jgi:hypothetical protein
MNPEIPFIYIYMYRLVGSWSTGYSTVGTEDGASIKA